MRSSSRGEFGSKIEFVILCDFLAGSSIADLTLEFRMTDRQVETLLRSALFSYGFRSGT